MSEVVDAIDLAAHVARLVDHWKPRLKIAERVEIRIDELVPPDGAGEVECAMFAAEMVPEADGSWDFRFVVSPTHTPADLEHAVVHELVHLLLEPIRRVYFSRSALEDTYPSFIIRGPSANDQRVHESLAAAAKQGGVLIPVDPGTVIEPVFPAAAVDIWETIIERVADAFESGYPPADDPRG